ncbi:MAG: hypothetical protein HFE67_08960 [Erysipelotrichaceae bacterium]|nr:hypothetical protein [Erysipelotrichaceae bacterium]
MIDNDVYLSEDISDLPYEEIKEAIRVDIVDKLSASNCSEVIWDPEFVLELAPQEFPELYPSLYLALMAQGYDADHDIIASIDSETENSSSGMTAYASGYTSTKYYSYVASGHGTVIAVKSTLEWSYGSGVYTITSMSGERTAGWPMANKVMSKRYNGTANAYGFYSYYALKDAYSFSAYLQIQIVPKANGTATQVVLSEGVNAIGIG